MPNLAPSPPTDAAESVEFARWLAPLGTAAAVCLGLALQLSNGFLNPAALCLVAIAFALVVASALAPRPAYIARRDFGVVRLLAVAGLALHLGYLYMTPPAMYLQLHDDGLAPFHRGLAVLALAGGLAVWGVPRRAMPLLVAVLVAAHFALGAWVIRRSPDPTMDVFQFHRDAIAALRAGINPYAITFPNIYTNADFYGPGLSVDGRLQFGFPYFPLSLLVSMPGQILGGDPRYAQLVAIELAAVLMASARRNGLGLMAAALFLTTPRIFFVLEQSWTEPFLVFGIASVVFAACRHGRLVPWLFGAFVALKQYLVLALPAVLLLVKPPETGRMVAVLLAKAALIGGVVTLPFFLWNPGAFWHSVAALQFHQPFRGDSLGFLSWWVSRGNEPPSAVASFVVASLASGLALWRLPRTPAGFGAAVAMTFFAFFAFNKQAFCNYYFFVVGTLYVSVSAWRAPGALE